MSEVRIPKRVVEKDAGKAKRLAEKNTNIPDPVERFNAGFSPLTREGKPSVLPLLNPEFHPRETNEAGIAVVRGRLETLIAEEKDERKKEELRTAQSELHVEQLIHPVRRATEAGDFIRETPDSEFITDPETGKKFRVIKYNWDKKRDGEPVTILRPPYNNKIDNGATVQTRNTEIAAQMPDIPFLAIAHPGMGSESLTKQQKKELETPQSYFSIADAELRAFKELGVDTINIVGHSMGAFTGLATAVRANEHDITVNKVVLAGLTGVEETSVIEMGKNFFGDGKYMKSELAGHFEPFIYEGSNLSMNPAEEAWKTFWWSASFLTHDPKLRYIRAMTKDTATARLRMVLTNQPESKVVIIGGTNDKVSPESGINKAVQTLREEGFDNTRVARMMFPGGPHSVMENSMRHVGMIKHALTGSAL